MIDVAVSYGCKTPRVTKKAVQRVVSLVCKKEGMDEGKISCVFVDDTAIRKIHSTYLGYHTTTDVITFLLETEPSPEAELYINVNQARRQARRYKVTLSNELTRLLIHGLLHVLGYDDKRTNDREKMFALQEQYVDLCSTRKRAI